MIASWVSPSAIEVKCDCSPQSLAIYYLGFPRHPTEGLWFQFMHMSNVKIDDRRIQCDNVNRKMKGCRLSGEFPSQLFLSFLRFLYLGGGNWHGRLSVRMTYFRIG